MGGGPQHVIVRVADHQDPMGPTGLLEQVGDHICLVLPAAVHGGAADFQEVAVQVEVGQDLLGGDFRFGGGHV